MEATEKRISDTKLIPQKSRNPNPKTKLSLENRLFQKTDDSHSWTLSYLYLLVHPHYEGSSLILYILCNVSVTFNIYIYICLLIVRYLHDGLQTPIHASHMCSQYCTSTVSDRYEYKLYDGLPILLHASRMCH